MSEGTTLTFRPASAEDGPLLFALFAASRREWFLRSGMPPAQVDGLLQMQHRAQQHGHRASSPMATDRILVVAGRPVGRMLVDTSGPSVLLVDIAVLPELRGQGWGTAALRALFEEADRAGKPVALQVACDSPARRLYQRLGFREGGTDGVYVRMERAPAEAIQVPDRRMLEATRAGFQELVHQTLTATPFKGGERVALQLQAVDSIPGAKHPESFRLLFHGPAQPPLRQDTYAVEHPRFERQVMFLVPVGQTAEAIRYEAVFNRG